MTRSNDHGSAPKRAGTAGGTAPQGGQSRADIRAERLAQALRANLRRRKEKARGVQNRSGEVKGTDDEEADDLPGAGS